MGLVLQLRTTGKIKEASGGKGEVVYTKFTFGPTLLIPIANIPEEGMKQADAYVRVEMLDSRALEWSPVDQTDATKEKPSVLQLKTVARIREASEDKNEILTMKFPFGPCLIIVIFNVPNTGAHEAPAYVKVELLDSRALEWAPTYDSSDDYVFGSGGSAARKKGAVR
jgi:hypothetical protein